MEEKAEKGGVEELSQNSKRDFLKAMGVGIGITGLAAVFGGQAFA